MTLIELKAAIFDLNVSLEANQQKANQVQMERNNIQLELIILQRQLQELSKPKEE